MNRRTFTGLLIGSCITTKAVSQNSEKPRERDYEDYRRFFKQLNGFELNSHQHRWYNIYHKTKNIIHDPAHISSRKYLRGSRQTGLTTFAWSTMLFSAIHENNRVGLMTSSYDARMFVKHIMNTSCATYLQKYSEDGFGAIRFLTFQGGGGINFISTFDDMHGYCFAEMWQQEDGNKGVRDLMIPLVSKYQFHYGTA